MKRTITLITLCFMLAGTVHAQKVSEKAIIGTWKLIINVEEEMDREAEDADSMLAEVFIKSISGLVGGILEDIDIYFEFRKNNKLSITVTAYDETETEEGTWYINKKGYLVIDDIESDDDKFNISTDDDEWKLIDGILVSEEHEDDRTVYMARVD